MARYIMIQRWDITVSSTLSQLTFVYAYTVRIKTWKDIEYTDRTDFSFSIFWYPMDDRWKQRRVQSPLLKEFDFIADNLNAFMDNTKEKHVVYTDRTHFSFCIFYCLIVWRQTIEKILVRITRRLERMLSPLTKEIFHYCWKMIISFTIYE